MTITVGMPYYGCPETVERAVRSVLEQSVDDLALVVIGDGEDPPISHIRDSRLVVYRLPHNRGAYFGQQLILSANPHEWYAPHAADDWTAQDHLERLTHYGTDVATGAVWYHSQNDVKPRRVVRKLYEVGLYRTERMLAIGGYNPAERIGQDSLTLRLMRLIAPMPASRYPTYHRCQRAGSLSTDPLTKRGSQLRNEMKARNRAVFAKCQELRRPERIRAYRQTLIPEPIRDELAEHAERLRRELT